MALEVRAYRDGDHDAVVALWRDAFPGAPARNDPVTDIRRMLAHDPEHFLVACTDGLVRDGKQALAAQNLRLVGTALAGYDGHRGWLHLVAVAADARRRGIGRALTTRAEALLAARGCPKLNLQVRATTPEAVAFYERLGYAVEERISMGKTLPSAEL